MILHPWPLLSLIVFLPLLGAMAIWLFPAKSRRFARDFSAIVAFVTLALTLMMAAAFKPATFHYQFGESLPWIPQFGISYLIGVDGISLWLVVLTALLGFAGILITPKHGDDRDREVREDNRREDNGREDDVRGKYALMLALTTTMLGTFVALDLVLFYTFFELSLIPVALLILQRGGRDGREGERRKAAIRFFGALFAGSILMLVGMVVLSRLHFDATGRTSFSLLDLQAQAASGALWRGAVGLQPWIFWSFALAFLVKSPALPFHSWLPGTYEQSPLAPIVASVVLKVGTYGLFRFCLPLFPESVQAQLPLLTIIGVAGILYGAAIAITQRGIGRLLAFSTVSHVGFILIGLFSLTHAGLMGAAFQQTNHGLTAGALLIMVALLHRRRATHEIEAFGALKRTMPIFAALFFVVLLGNVGLPGTSGFVGEFLTMLGAFEAGLAGSYGLSLPAAILAGAGTVLAAGYLLYMFQRMFTGPATERANLKDLALGETALAALFAGIILYAGVRPGVFTRGMATSVEATRMMAVLPAGQRPSWIDTDQEVLVTPTGSESSLLRIPGRDVASIGDGPNLAASASPPGSPVIATLPLHPRAESRSTEVAAH